MKKLIQNIFSIRNKEMHKVITILGLRIASKTKKQKKTIRAINEYVDFLFAAILPNPTE